MAFKPPNNIPTGQRGMNYLTEAGIPLHIDEITHAIGTQVGGFRLNMPRNENGGGSTLQGAVSAEITREKFGRGISIRRGSSVYGTAEMIEGKTPDEIEILIETSRARVTESMKETLNYNNNMRNERRREITEPEFMPYETAEEEQIGSEEAQPAIIPVVDNDSEKEISVSSNNFINENNKKVREMFKSDIRSIQDGVHEKGRQFEILSAMRYVKQGYDVILKPAANSNGDSYDILVSGNFHGKPFRLVIEAKFSSNGKGNVRVETIRVINDAAGDAEATHTEVCTNGKLSKAAIRLAKEKQISIIDIDALIDALISVGIGIRKHDRMLEYVGLPELTEENAKKMGIIIEE